MTSSPPLYGAIEAGGTKMICAVARTPLEPMKCVRIATGEPAETLSEITNFFQLCEQEFGELNGIGIGSFGPVDIEPSSPAFGQLLRTPKLAWRGTNMVRVLRDELNCPVFIDTDVTCALIAESHWGASRDVLNSVYITIGTGIGGAAIMGRQVLRGFTHTEIGHQHASPIDPNDEFEGACPSHGNTCFEGLASGKALELKWGPDYPLFDETHPAWAEEAEYLARLCFNLLTTLTPERIILGGGVMAQHHLFTKIRARLNRLNGGYVDLSRYGLDEKTLICPPEFDGRAGLIGALELARQQTQSSSIWSKA